MKTNVTKFPSPEQKLHPWDDDHLRELKIRSRRRAEELRDNPPDGTAVARAIGVGLFEVEENHGKGQRRGLS